MIKLCVGYIALQMSHSSIWWNCQNAFNPYWFSSFFYSLLWEWFKNNNLYYLFLFLFILAIYTFNKHRIFIQQELRKLWHNGIKSWLSFYPKYCFIFSLHTFYMNFLNNTYITGIAESRQISASSYSTWHFKIIYQHSILTFHPNHSE